MFKKKSFFLFFIFFIALLIPYFFYLKPVFSKKKPGQDPWDLPKSLRRRLLQSQIKTESKNLFSGISIQDIYKSIEEDTKNNRLHIFNKYVAEKTLSNVFQDVFGYSKKDSKSEIKKLIFYLVRDFFYQDISNLFGTFEINHYPEDNSSSDIFKLSRLLYNEEYHSKKKSKPQYKIIDETQITTIKDDELIIDEEQKEKPLKNFLGDTSIKNIKPASFLEDKLNDKDKSRLLDYDIFNYSFLQFKKEIKKKENIYISEKNYDDEKVLFSAENGIFNLILNNNEKERVQKLNNFKNFLLLVYQEYVKNKVLARVYDAILVIAYFLERLFYKNNKDEIIIKTDVISLFHSINIKNNFQAKYFLLWKYIADYTSLNNKHNEFLKGGNYSTLENISANINQKETEVEFYKGNNLLNFDPFYGISSFLGFFNEKDKIKGLIKEEESLEKISNFGEKIYTNGAKKFYEEENDSNNGYIIIATPFLLLDILSGLKINEKTKIIKFDDESVLELRTKTNNYNGFNKNLFDGKFNNSDSYWNYFYIYLSQETKNEDFIKAAKTKLYPEQVKKGEIHSSFLWEKVKEFYPEDKD